MPAQPTPTRLYDESDLLPLSGLAHMAYCPRRAALIHIERLWAESAATMEGAHFHRRVDAEIRLERQGEKLIARSLHIRSLQLGLVGIADVVEFTPTDHKENGCRLPEQKGWWHPFPVEYKRGRLRQEQGYLIQLCAQAMCLEHILEIHIKNGALFFGKTRRRLDVSFDDTLRVCTLNAAQSFHELVRTKRLPPAHYSKKCKECSLVAQCMPRESGKSAATHNSRMMRVFEDDTCDMS
ncbi:CRISPR-associated protein Cas4 [Desulfovibrio inopinatus]|uniref:CRISPR-associated protein Cas4 n=1 Tax=Desulfovibrio inopinatus TaxID=102109 RepID=UPI0004096AD1|nr:CRISPR-associated protein Cas4 [Desulfovibrio inopinatus]